MLHIWSSIPTRLTSSLARLLTRCVCFVMVRYTCYHMPVGLYNIVIEHGVGTQRFRSNLCSGFDRVSFPSGHTLVPGLELGTRLWFVDWIMDENNRTFIMNFCRIQSIKNGCTSSKITLLDVGLKHVPASSDSTGSKSWVPEVATTDPHARIWSILDNVRRPKEVFVCGQHGTGSMRSIVATLCGRW